MPKPIHDGLTNDQRWRRRHPEKRAAIAAQYQAARRAADPDGERAKAREQYAKHRATRLKDKRVYYQKVRKARDQTDEGRYRDRARKAKRRGAVAGDVVTLEEWQAIILKFNGCCAYCGVEPEALEQDHVQALSRGGRHIASNIVPACKPCNSSKGAR